MKEQDIGNKIKEIRGEQKLSQSKVVEKLEKYGIHMSRETLSKIENNSRTISALELNTICKILNIDIGEFFYEEDTDDLVTFFRKRKFSEDTLEEISELQEMVKVFINQEKIYKEDWQIQWKIK